MPIQQRNLNGKMLAWAEVLDDPSDGIDAMFEPERSSATMKIMFGSEKDFKLGIPQILGYATAGGAGITRLPPWQHVLPAPPGRDGLCDAQRFIEMRRELARQEK